MGDNQLSDLLFKLGAVDDPTIPPWALLLIESFRVLITEFKGLHDISKRFSELDDISATCRNTSDLLKADNIRLNHELNELRDRVDDQEQRNRNYCLILHGVDETPNESTDDVVAAVINDNLGINLSVDEIERSHRLGPLNITDNRQNLRSSKKYCRPIIVRFKFICKKIEVFKSKRALKGKQISISENLTKHRYVIYKAAMQKYCMGKVWTNDGRITTKVGERYIIINSMKDLSESNG